MVDKSGVLSLPVPHCPYLSVKENDYEQRRSQVRVLPSTPFEPPKLRGLLLRFITVVGLRRTNFRRPLQIPPVSPITMKHATESRGMRYATREPRVTLSGSEQPRYYQDTRTNQRNSHDAPQRQNRDRVGDSRADHDPGCSDQTQCRAKKEIDLTKKDIPESRKDCHWYLDHLAHADSQVIQIRSEEHTSELQSRQYL